MALIKAEFMSQMVFLLQWTFHITCTKYASVFSLKLMVVFWLGELLVRGGAQSSHPPLSTLCMWLSCSLKGNHPFMLCVQSKNPHTPTLPSLGFLHLNWGFTHVHGCVCKHTHSFVRHVQGAGKLCLHHDCVHISASPSSSVGSPWALPSPSGFLQQQSKTPRECFSASIKTCWDSLTLSPPSGIFPQENIKCMWLSWAFPELCEGLGSHPGGALLPVPLWPSLMYSSETSSRIQRMTAGCPPSPPHTIYFLYRMSVSSELNGSYVTREKNKKAM